MDRSFSISSFDRSRPFAVALAASLVLIAGVNALEIWQTARHAHRVAEAAAALPAGHAVIFTGFPDERPLHMARLAVVSGVRTVVFGSSRARELTTTVTGHRAGELYNAAIAAATVEDYIAMWSTLRRLGRVPEVAIFSVDAWVFNGSETQVQWISVAGDVERFLSSVGVPRSLALDRVLYAWYRGRDVLSYAVLRQALGASERTRLVDPRVPQSEIRGRQAVLTDGSLVNVHATYVPDAAVLRYVARGARLSDFRWDATRAARMELLWRDMRAQGVRVVSYMPPYHPLAWSRLAADPASAAAIRMTEGFLEGLAREVGGRFANFSDPGTVPCAAGEFFDAVHAAPSCLARVVRALRARD